MTITSVNEFVRLRTSDNPDDYLRAANECVSHDGIWDQLIEDYPDMKIWIVHNKTVSIPVLERLSLDDDPDVREQIARKRKISRLIFERLATDSVDYVRAALAYNAKIPLDILDLLRSDGAVIVRDAARRTA